MYETITEGPQDGADGDATGAADAFIDHSDEYDLFDRDDLYAKEEESYKHQWEKPASHKLSLQEAGVDKIRDFDSNDDDHHPSDNHKGHPSPDRCAIPAYLNLSAMSVKMRRTKKVLLLICFLLSVTYIPPLFDPQSRILSTTDTEMSYSNSEYMQTDDEHDSEGEELDLGDNSYQEAPPLDTAQTNEAFGVAQGFVQEVGGGNHPPETSDTEAEEWGKTEIDNLQDPMEQQQPQQPSPEENNEQVSVLEAGHQVEVGNNEADDVLNPRNNDPAPDVLGQEPSPEDYTQELLEAYKGLNSRNNDTAQNGSGQELPQHDYTQGAFGNLGESTLVANDVMSSLDNNEQNLEIAEEQNAELTIDEEGPIHPLRIAAKFRSLDTFNTGEQPNDDLPFFWYIPKAGSNLVEDILMKCYSLVGVTSKSGLSEHEDDAEPLETYTGEDVRKYVNVNISSAKGLQSAINRGFVQSKLADVVISPLIKDVSEIFDNNSASEPDEQQQQRLGRCFTLFRNPIDRAVSVYYNLQATSEKWKDTTIDEYAKSIDCESNWMVRGLTGKLNGGILTPKDTKRAKDFIRDYCVIGLEEQLVESIRRFQEAFGWQSKAMECIDTTARNGVLDTLSHEKFDEQSFIWKLLFQNNQEDMELYRYAAQLFNERAST